MTAIAIVSNASSALVEDPRSVLDVDAAVADAGPAKDASEGDNDRVDGPDAASVRARGPAHCDAESDSNSDSEATDAEARKSQPAIKGVPVRRGSLVSFPPDPVLETRTRPATPPREKEEHYYVPADFQRFRREYREALRKKALAKRRKQVEAAAAVGGRGGGNAGRFASPLTALVNSAMRTYASYASAAESSSSSSSAAAQGGTTSASTSTLVDTMYLF